MNKNRHRIVFNAARGQRMAVQETATSTGRGRQAASGASAGCAVAISPTGADSDASTPWTLTKLLACLAWAAWLPLGQAQIVADPGAPRTQRPQVLAAPNGVPLVHVATPSAAGVSVNSYSQFDVNGQGAILNNSRTNTSTQLGGWVQGNPWLATGSARIIVNQVNSSNPSHLNGYVEVAGQRAEVVIANPSGISVDGGGFINASRVTLTTGAPQYGMGGALDGYVVRGGTVSVGGAGLDLSTTDYAGILARAVQINAAIHASELKVVAGASQVSADHSQVSGAAASGAAPAYALDVAALGGMYANKIVLVGTEAGLGVRNAGTIGAGVGGLVVTAAGRLENTGVLQSTADAGLQAASLANTGRIAAAQTLAVRTDANLANTAGGTLAAQSLQLDAGAVLDNRGGTLRQSSGAALSIAAPQVSNTGGGWIGTEPVAAGGGSGGASAGGAGSGSNGSNNASGSASTGGASSAGSAPAPSPAPGYIAPAGHLQAGSALLNDGGKVYAGGPVTVQTPDLVNSGGTLSVATLSLKQPGFSNQGGTLNVTGAFSAEVDRFDNTGGTVRAGSLAVQTTGDLVNEGGTLASDSDARLTAGGQLRNGQGTLSAVGALDAQATGAVDNRGGTLQANQGLQLRGASLANDGGGIQSTAGAAQLSIAGALDNGAGRIGAATDLQLQAGSLSNAAGGSLRAGQDLDLQASGAVTQAGSVSAGRNASITAGSLQSTGILAAGIKADGTLDSQGDLRVSTTGALAAQGSNIAAGQMALQGASLDLGGSQTQAAAIGIQATAGDVNTRHATVTTPGALGVQASGALANDAGTLSANAIALDAGSITNTQGGRIVQTGSGDTTVRASTSLDNSAGLIATNGQNLQILGGVLRNEAGTIQHAGGGTLTVTGDGLAGNGGQIVSNGDLVAQVQGDWQQAGGSTSAQRIALQVGGALDNGVSGVNGASGANSASGQLIAARDATLTVGSLNNSGTLRAGQALSISATGAVGNSGQLSAGSGATLSAGSLRSTGLIAAGLKDDGTLDTQGDLRVSTSGNLVAQGQNLAAGQMALQGTGVDLSGSQTQAASIGIKATAGDAITQRATISTPGALDVQATGTLANDAGTLSADRIALDAGSISNTQAGRILQTGGSDTAIRAQTQLDNSGGLIASNGQNVQLQGGAIRNEAGRITHAGTGTLAITGSSLAGNGGQIVSNGDLVAQVQVDWQQAGGSTSAQNIALQAGGAVDNGVSGTGANSVSGELIAARDAMLTVGSLRNDGTLRAGQALGISATGAVSNSGQLSAGGSATVTAGSLQSTGLLAAGLKADGTLDTQGDLRVSTTGALAAQGSNLAAGQMALQGASVDLSGSQTQAAAITIKATTGDANTQRATVSTSGQLTVEATGTLANDAGTLSADRIALDAATITNTQAGRILQTGNGDTTLRASTVLDNSGGLIATNGRNLQLQGGALRNEAGAIQHAGTGTLTVNGSSLAGNGGQIVTNGDLNAQVQGDWQQAGGSTSAQNITLQAGGALDNGTRGTGANSVSGELIAARDATLTVGSLSNDGALRAGQALGISATGAVGNSGQLSAGGSATVTAGSVQSTGLIAAGLKPDGTLDTQGDLRVSTTGALAAQGSNLAAGQMALQGASVDLSGSQTQAAAITIKATAGDANTQRAIVSTPGALNVQATGTLANDAGTLSADRIALDAASITNTQGGRILQTGNADTLLRASTLLDNSGGLIASNGQNLQLQGGAIRNEAGRIQHAGTGTLTVSGDSLQGAGGQIVGNGALVGQVQGAWNQAGGSSLAERITLSTGSLDNSAGGQIVQSGTGAMQLSVTGAASNAGGRIAGNGALTATADSLDNRGGTLQAANGGDLGVTVQGTLDNSAGGQLLAANDARITAGALTNDTGRIAAVGTLAATVAGAASNRGGSITANGAVTLAAERLNNANGVTGSSQASLDLQAAQGLDNRNGRLQAATDLDLRMQGGTLDNRGGRVLGDAVTIDSAGGSLNNSEGVIGASGGLRIDSGAILNDSGLIQSGGALAIDTHGQALSNVNAAGAGTRRQGQDNGIASGGAMTLSTGALDNTQGYLGAAGTLTATTSGQFSNTGGTVFSQSTLSIDTQSAAYDNHGGSTQAQGDLRIDAGAIANQDGGLIRASGTTTLASADWINNGNTRGSNQGIEGQSVVVTARYLSNDQGSVRANQDIGVTANVGLDNRGGLVSAGGALSLTDTNAANPSTKTLAVTNTGGTLEAGRSLGLNAASFSGDGVLSSQGDLAIDLTQSLTNNATLRSNGRLRYATTGDLTNNGQLIAGTDLEVEGSQVVNNAGAEMSGQNTHVGAGALTNRGLIDSQGLTRIDAGSVDNVGTGRIYGNHVAIGAGSVTNREENGSSATIAARQRLDIGATTVTNREHALIFSGGDMAIAGGLDANGYAVGQGDTLYNHSAQIEALGNMSISMRNVDNRDVHVTLGAPNVRVRPRAEFLVAGTLIGLWEFTTTEQEDTATNADPARITAGGDLSINGALTNYVSRVTAGGSMNVAGGVRNESLWGQRTQVNSPALVTNSANGKQFIGHWPEDPPQTFELVASQTQSGLNASQGYNSGNAPAGAAANGNTGAAGSASGGSARPVIVEVPAQVGAPANASSSSAGTAQGSQAAPQTAGSADPASAGSAQGVQASLRSANSADPGSASLVQAQSATDKAARQFAGSKAADASGDAAAAQAAAGATATVPMVIRTTTPALTLPQASLFSITPGASSHYLVETDPRFANYRQWLSSDYLLNALGLDPSATQKRLGDGFYEQMLVNQQVQQLTGYRFLDGYDSDDAQYTALMNAGATFARQYNLRPGMALSAEQMAQLTSDIVWLVEQTVTLADGSTQKVLVPQVYVRARPGDIDGSGALLSAGRLSVKDPNASFTNGGTVAGRTLVSIDSRNVAVLNGRISGGNVALKAKEDIAVVGGTVDAIQSLSVQAGGDVNLVTTTATQTGPLSSVTGVDRVAGLYVHNPSGTLSVSAGRDLNLAGAQVVNDGTGVTSLSAVRDVNIGTVQVGSSAIGMGQSSIARLSQSAEVGSRIASGGGLLSIRAGQDLNARQASVDAGQGLALLGAGRDMVIAAGESSTDLSITSTDKRRGLLTSKYTQTQTDASSTQSVGSSIQGGLVWLHARRDLLLEAAKVEGTQGVGLTAGRDLAIVEGRDTTTVRQDTQTSKTLAGPPGRGDANIKKTGTTVEIATDTANASRITSGQGGITIQAGSTAFLQGAQVEAAKDVTIRGGNVIVQAAQDTTTVTGSHTTKSGLLDTDTHILTDVGKGLKAKETGQTELTRTDLARSSITGANVTVETTGTAALSATDVSTPGTLTLKGENVVLGTQASQTGTRTTSQGRDLVYQVARDSGKVDQTTQYNRLNVGQLDVQAQNVQVDVGVRDSIAQLSKQSGMAWMDQLLNDPAIKDRIDWHQVEEVHKQWKDDQQGLTKEGGIIVTVVVTWLTWGAASGVGATAGNAAAVGAGEGVALAGGGTFLTATGATISSVVGGAVAAGVSALASQAARSLISNQFDLGKTLKDLGSSSNVHSLVTAILTGGALAGLDMNPTGMATAGSGAQGFATQLGQNLQAGAIRAVIDTAVNGGSLQDRLTNGFVDALVNTAAAQGADWIGNNAALNSFASYASHAVAGCIGGIAKAGNSSGCEPGAIGAALGEAAAVFYNSGREPLDLLLNGPRPGTTEFAGMVSTLGAALAGADADQLNLANWAGQNAAANNFWMSLARTAALSCVQSPGCTGLVLATTGLASRGITPAQVQAAFDSGALNIQIQQGVSPAVAQNMFAASLLTYGFVQGVVNMMTTPPPSGSTAAGGGYGAGTQPQQQTSTGGNQVVQPAPGSQTTGGNQIADPSGNGLTPGGYAEGSTPEYGGPTTTPEQGAIVAPVVFNAPGHPSFDPSRDPSVRGYQGGTQESIDRINSVLAGSQDTSTGTGVPNATQPESVSRQVDFDYLTRGATISTPRPEVSVGILSDGTRIVSRPSSTGPITIEIQRPDGRPVLEIRYGRK